MVYFKSLLGLKSSAERQQLEARLVYQPHVLEFFTAEEDFSPSGIHRLTSAIDQAYASGVKEVVLHHPMTYKGRYVELVAHPSNNPELVAFINFSTQELIKIAKAKGCRVLVHGSYEMQELDLLGPFANLSEAEGYLLSRLTEFHELGGETIMFENGIAPLFSFGDPAKDQALAKLGLPLAYDISHAFIAVKGDNQALQQSLMTLKDQIVHYHLVDSQGQTHDSLPLGQGKIDWQAVMPLLSGSATSIYEIVVKDLTNPVEQINSHQFLQNLADELTNAFPNR